MNIVVYSKSNCPNCETAKNMLKAKNMPFKEISLENEQEREGFYKTAGVSVRQLPQIFINGQRIGGYLGLREWIKWKESQK